MLGVAYVHCYLNITPSGQDGTSATAGTECPLSLPSSSRAETTGRYQYKTTTLATGRCLVSQQR